MTTTDPTAAEVTALRERLAEAREHWRQVADALARAETERDHLRFQLAEARQQRDQAAEALVQAETERDDAREAHQRLANWLRKRIQLAMDIVGHLLAPETAPESPQTDEQAQVRGDSHTEASAGADGPWSDAWCRTQLQRLSIAASEQYGLRWRDYDVVGAVIAEIDRLRAALGSQGGSR